MHFILTHLSPSTSISPLSTCLVCLDSCPLSVEKLHNCLSQGIAHSPFWIHSSPRLRLFLSILSILPADFTPRTDPSTSFKRVSRPLSACRPSSTINSVTFLTANLRSTFRVPTLVMDSELTGTSSGGSIPTSGRNAVLKCCTVVAVASKLSNHTWRDDDAATFSRSSPPPSVGDGHEYML